MNKEANLPDYRIPILRSLLWSVIAFAADIIAIPAILRNKPMVSKKELEEIGTHPVPFYDRVALRQDEQKRDHFRILSDDVLRGAIGLAALLFADKKLRAHAAQILTLYVATHAVAYTIYSYSPLGPAFRNKYRPVVYYHSLPDDQRTRGNNRNSGYSGHTGNAAAASFFMAKMVADHHPQMEPKSKAALYGLALVPPLVVGGLRIKALKHFPADIAMAIIVGALCGILVPALHRRAGRSVVL